MHSTRALRVGAVVAALALVGAACGGDDSGDDNDSTTTEAAADTTATESTDASSTTEAGGATTTAAGGASTTAGGGASTTAGGGGEVAGALVGFKGTTPLVELSDDFKARLATTPSGAALVDYNYAAESYDAVVLIALAAEAAETDGAALAEQIVAISGGGDAPGEKCADFTSCKAIIDAGGTPDYDGQAGPTTMNGNGEPLVASYGVLSFGADNRIDDSLTRYETAEAPESAVVPLTPVDVQRAGDGVLHIGSLLPQTGSLAFLGPPEFAGVELAIAEINAAGGVLGQPVEYTAGDSGDASTDLASQTTDSLLSAGVDAIVGAASSSVSKTVVDKITAAGVIQFSPANTSDEFTTYPDHGLYFRNAPPDLLQGSVLGQVILDDGVGSVSILALDDAYGNGLANRVEEVLTGGGVEVKSKTIYDPKATSFASEIDTVKSDAADAIVLITFDEGSRILRGLVEAGIGPNEVPTYGVDGNTGNALGENFDEGT
jgi:ABC-type branched-subunit amino acid transport system substrate-binding protein